MRLELRPSRLLALWALITHAGALVCLWLAEPPLWAEVALGALILAGYLDLCTRHVLRTRPGAVVALIHPDRGPWRVVTRDGTVLAADIRGDTWVHPWLILLSFERRPKGTMTVLLPPDGADPNELRRLRVLLRTRGADG